jgi:hypothetical protein
MTTPNKDLVVNKLLKFYKKIRFVAFTLKVSMIFETQIKIKKKKK